MARIETRVQLDFSVTFTVDEEEARALNALAGYGDDNFIKVFYEKLGTAYMKDHEEGLRRFLKSIRESIPYSISSINDARKTLSNKK